MTRKLKPSTPAERQRAMRQRAAATIVVTLDAEHASALRWLCDETGQTTAALIRTLIADEAARRK